MNFKIAKSELLNALNLCTRAISTTTPLPSLAGIKFVLDNESLTLISSDSNISIKTVIRSNDMNTLTVYEPGEIVLDARYIVEIIRKFEGEFINVETIDGTLIKVYDDKADFKINGMNANDYPMISFDMGNAQPFNFSTLLFNQIIDETAFACSESETRPVLTGVNLKAHDRKIFANATDSYRLASKTIDIDTDLNFDITIPKKYLNEIYHAIANNKEVTIAIDRQKISFMFDDTVIETRLLDDE
ncbi:MAG: DNA polymerase III subunit beta, partial [Erysipelotrichaceae bacterium]|nr:DNA polymerase III subunit beta [Erysipelotrichaceae bacterium]